MQTLTATEQKILNALKLGDRSDIELMEITGFRQLPPLRDVLHGLIKRGLICSVGTDDQASLFSVSRTS